MKKFAVVLFLIFFLAGLVLVFAGGGEGENARYLRIHIRANSNSSADQSVKYLVRERVVDLLTPTVAACESKEEALSALEVLLPEIEACAAETLRENGFSYGARASLRRENFPTRVYESVTLPAGVYDALILELGTGEGDNWWCVVYPPLCFSAAGGNIVYRSKILEIIRAFFA